MASPRMTAADRLNATRSTGPRTRPGKAKAKSNAVQHGLRSLSPVLPGEDPAEWERFLAAVIDDLAPVGRSRPRWRPGSPPSSGGCGG